MKFVINRKKWLRGEGPDSSALLREADGKMCCLGFYGIACGMSPDLLRGKQQPDNVKGYPEWLAHDVTDHFYNRTAYVCTSDCAQLMGVNDANSFTEAEREEKIIRLFAKHDVEVEFVG